MMTKAAETLDEYAKRLFKATHGAELEEVPRGQTYHGVFFDDAWESVDEGVGSIAASKLADLARGFILKARPIVILHNSETNSTITFKLKRGLLRHTLYRHEEGKGEKVVGKYVLGTLALGVAIKQATRLMAQGYLEI